MNGKETCENRNKREERNDKKKQQENQATS